MSTRAQLIGNGVDSKGEAALVPALGELSTRNERVRTMRLTIPNFARRYAFPIGLAQSRGLSPNANLGDQMPNSACQTPKTWWESGRPQNFPCTAEASGTSDDQTQGDRPQCGPAAPWLKPAPTRSGLHNATLSDTQRGRHWGRTLTEQAEGELQEIWGVGHPGIVLAAPAGGGKLAPSTQKPSPYPPSTGASTYP